MSIIYTAPTFMDLYHICNHSIEGRDLFYDTQDYARFVHNMYEFNDTVPAGNSYRSFEVARVMDARHPSLDKIDVRPKKLVEVHGWCLMKDHYHLLLSDRVEGGILQFMRKLNVGYSKYYNERYHRTGFVLKGKTKKIRIQRHAHYLYILHYVHLNPLDYQQGAEKWRERSKSGIKNLRKAKDYLTLYRWSSYLDYIGISNFPSILTKSLFTEKKNPRAYEAELIGYLRDAAYPFDSSLVLE